MSSQTGAARFRPPVGRRDLLFRDTTPRQPLRFAGPRQAQKIVERVAERARISQNVTPDVLWSTFATMALEKGISLAAVQKILGHERIGITAFYLNVTGTHVVEKLLIALTPMMILSALRAGSKESSEGQTSSSRKEALVQWQNRPGMAARSGRRTVRKSKCES